MVGERKFNRPFDIRVAQNDSLLAYGIKKGDVFTVSSQAAVIVIPNADFDKLKLVAADDATPGSARKVPVEELKGLEFGVQDHHELIKEALKHVESRKAERLKNAIIQAREHTNKLRGVGAQMINAGQSSSDQVHMPNATRGVVKRGRESFERG